MQTTRLSSKGQVIIPQVLRESHQWKPGLELVVEDQGEGILLKPSRPFAASVLHQVAGCLAFDGPAKSFEEMEAAIRKGVREHMT